MFKFTIFTLEKIFISLLLLIAFTFLADAYITKSQNNNCYDNINKIPYNKVGLFLGTGKYINKKYINLYYLHRINACVDLYKAGKISIIVVSGDNSRKDYDEPSTIKADLVKKGIPANKIYLDYAGFRTLDSIVRVKEIFGQNKITIISQEFHNQRALYIAEKKGISAVAYNAKNVSKRYGYKVMLREKLARIKAIMDITFHKNAKFLGKKIIIDFS